MMFTVANVICRFNSSSGGPPRVVSLIAQAGIAHWRSELFTTSFTESNADSLLTPEFPGAVKLMDGRAQTLSGGLARAMGLFNGASSQLVAGPKPRIVH